MMQFSQWQLLDSRLRAHWVSHAVFVALLTVVDVGVAILANRLFRDSGSQGALACAMLTLAATIIIIRLYWSWQNRSHLAGHVSDV
jgi:hypothetical protein